MVQIVHLVDGVPFVCIIIVFSPSIHPATISTYGRSGNFHFVTSNIWAHRTLEARNSIENTCGKFSSSASPGGIKALKNSTPINMRLGKRLSYRRLLLLLLMLELFPRSQQPQQPAAYEHPRPPKPLIDLSKTWANLYWASHRRRNEYGEKTISLFIIHIVSYRIVSHHIISYAIEHFQTIVRSCILWDDSFSL